MLLKKFDKLFKFAYLYACVFCVEVNATNDSRSFEFDVTGNLKKVILANRSSIEYEYDQKQHLTKVSDSEGKTFEYQYDLSGNCVQVQDENIITSYEYDGFNRPISAHFAELASIHYSYDARGRLKQITYPEGMQVSYSYDASGRLVSVEAPDGKTQYAYDHSNNTLSRVVLPNGTTTKYGYDKAKRIVSVLHTSKDNSLIVGFKYEFDNNGNRIRTEEIKKNGSKITDFSYDKLNRLTYVKYPEGYERYTYDSLATALRRKLRRLQLSMTMTKITA